MRYVWYTEAELSDALRRVCAGEAVEAVAKRMGRASVKSLREKLKALGWKPPRHYSHGDPLVLPTAPASVATDARPGSDLKIEVLRGRYERGECLYHADDCKGPAVRNLTPSEAYSAKLAESRGEVAAEDEDEDWEGEP